MKKIVISGEIGWDIFPFQIREQISSANGEDLDIDLSSPGGYVFDGIEINNLFRDYKRENPNSQMILNIKSEAASMGSYIAVNDVFDLVTIEDNVSFMIHNPIMGTYGDYQEMAKSADFLERLAIMMSRAYIKRSGKPENEIRKMMDDETWLFGEEIIKAGFADELIKTDKDKNKSSAIATSELKYKNVLQKIKTREIKTEEFERAAAIMRQNNSVSNSNIKSTKPAQGGDNKQEVIMNIDELKKDHPDIYAKVKDSGMEAGISQEKERVKSLLEMKKKKDFEGITAIHDRIDEAIENGETVIDVQTAINAMSMKGGAVAAHMDTKAIGDVNPGSAGTASGEEDKNLDEDEGF